MWAQRSQQGIKTGRFDEPCEGPLPGEGPHKASVAESVNAPLLLALLPDAIHIPASAIWPRHRAAV